MTDTARPRRDPVTEYPGLRAGWRDYLARRQEDAG